MDERTAPGTRLARVMTAFDLRPTDVLRTAKRIAAALQRPAVSRQQLARIRYDAASATEEKIFILVAALRELTGWLISAGDLFEVEPALPEGAIGAFPSLSPWRRSVLDGSNASVPVFSGFRRPQGRRRLPQDGPVLPGEEAFESLYTQYALLLRGIAIHRYGIPPDDAEAIVHDAFLAYLQRHTSIRDTKGWLAGTVRFQCCHYLRDRKREVPLLPEHDDTPDLAAEGDVRSSVDRLTMAAALARLGERCRETIRRFYWQDESMDDIAAGFSTTQNNVKQILFTCRRRIREFLRNHLGRRP